MLLGGTRSIAGDVLTLTANMGEFRQKDSMTQFIGMLNENNEVHLQIKTNNIVLKLVANDP